MVGADDSSRKMGQASNCVGFVLGMVPFCIQLSTLVSFMDEKCTCCTSKHWVMNRVAVRHGEGNHWLTTNQDRGPPRVNASFRGSVWVKTPRRGSIRVSSTSQCIFELSIADRCLCGPLSWCTGFDHRSPHGCVYCQECTQTAGSTVLHMFDPVTVQVSIDKSNIQHQRLALKLVRPLVSRYSLNRRFFCLWSGLEIDKNSNFYCGNGDKA